MVLVLRVIEDLDLKNGSAAFQSIAQFWDLGYKLNMYINEIIKEGPKSGNFWFIF